MVRIADRGLPSQSLVVIQKEGVGTQMLSSSKARNPLDLNGSDFSTLMKDVVHLLAEFLDHLPNAPLSNMQTGLRCSGIHLCVPLPLRVDALCGSCWKSSPEPQTTI